MTKRQCVKKVMELLNDNENVKNLVFVVGSEEIVIESEYPPEILSVKDKFGKNKNNPTWKPLIEGFYSKMAQLALNEIYMSRGIMYHNISDIRVSV